MAPSIGTSTAILKSPQDKKEYLHFTLPNGLAVLLIRDPEISNPPAPKHTDGKKTEHEEEESGDLTDDDEDEDEDDDEDMDEEDSGSSMSEDGASGSGSEGDDDEEEDGPGGGKKKKSGHAAVKKAAAAMAVGIGSLSDPANMQGLSHYLEHMLFMGSTKYPDENDYDDYITKHGGSCNAYTELEYTNYHFEVAPDALHGALDRFAQFFVSPLCKAGSLEREVLAVDSEFAGVVQSDSCRSSQLMCYTARPGHPYRQFSWGNKKSLWDQPLAAGMDVRQNIMDYYNKHYTAERMTLAVLGGEPLETLKSWVEEMFTGLPSGKGARPSFAGMPPPFKDRFLYVMPAVRDIHEVSLTFQLPCMFPHYLSKAEHYVSHLVGHEGPGSLLSYLKAKGWATEVCAGIDEDGYAQNSGCFLFSITVSLTEAGLTAGRGAGLEAVGAVFQYLNMLREAGPQEWIWKEMACIADMKFRFQEEEEAMDCCTKLATVLHLYRPEHVLAAEYLHETYNPELIQSVLSALHPSASEYRIDLLTRDFAHMKTQGLSQLAAEGGGSVAEDTEPWFNMEAAWVQLPQSLCDSWASSSPPPEMRLPPPNPYIATDFTVKGLQGPGGQQLTPEAAAAAAAADTAALAQQLGLPVVLATPPDLVLDKPGLRVWHKLDRTFATPRTNLHMRLSSPAWCASPRAAALTQLGLKLLEDEMTEDSYLADVAGLHYHMSPEGLTGIDIKVDGFSHKLDVLCSRLISCLRTATFPGAHFSAVKEVLLRKYRNINMQVFKHANYERLYALCASAQHFTELVPHLEAAELQDVTQHMVQALAQCHLEVLSHGNLTRQEALSLAAACQTGLGPGCEMGAGQRSRDACVQVPAGPHLVSTQPARNAEEENCCVEAYYQIGVCTTPEQRAMLDLVDQVVFEPAYNQLRTKEQLGYTVHTGTRLTHGVSGFCAVVVSATHTPDQVQASIEAFLTAFKKTLDEMSEEELVTQKAALAANKLSRDRALSDETARHWDHIWNQRFDFNAREAEVAALDKISLADIRTWWSSFLAASPQRRKLSVHVVPTKECAARGAAGSGDQATVNGGTASPVGDGKRVKLEAPGEVAVKDLGAWKRECNKHPLALGEPPAVVG